MSKQLHQIKKQLLLWLSMNSVPQSKLSFDLLFLSFNFHDS